MKYEDEYNGVKILAVFSCDVPLDVLLQRCKEMFLAMGYHPENVNDLVLLRDYGYTVDEYGCVVEIEDKK
jgi:hypothetical protein